MGSIVVNYPDISDADLVFDEQETKAVRAAIAQKNKGGMVERLSGIARLQRKPAPFYVATCHPIAWA